MWYKFGSYQYSLSDLALIRRNGHRVRSGIVAGLEAIERAGGGRSCDISEALDGGDIDGLQASEAVGIGHVHRRIDSLAGSNGLEVLSSKAGLFVVHIVTKERKIGSICMRT